MKNLNELLNELEKDSKIDRTNLESEIINCTTLYAKWLRYHKEFKSACIRGETLLAEEILKKQVFYSGQAEPHEYRGHPYGNIQVKNQSEMERYINGDPDLTKRREQVDTAIQGKELCQTFLDSLKYRPNHLKTVLEVRRFELGD